MLGEPGGLQGAGLPVPGLLGSWSRAKGPLSGTVSVLWGLVYVRSGEVHGGREEKRRIV